MQSSKSYQIRFEQRPEYLYAFVTAEREDYEISMAIWKEIVEHIDRDECEKIMVEQDIPQVDVAYYEKYDCVNNLVPELRRIDVAFVDKYCDQMELNKFTELVATNRGLTVKVFTDSDEAAKWLLSF